MPDDKKNIREYMSSVWPWKIMLII
jgi:hypothetical protein